MHDMDNGKKERGTDTDNSERERLGVDVKK